MQALVDLLQQAADPAQAEIPERFAFRNQGYEIFLLDAQAEGVPGRPVQGAGRPLAHQSGQGEAFALTDFEGGFGSLFGFVLALARIGLA